MMTATNITAMPMIAWSAPSRSSKLADHADDASFSMDQNANSPSQKSLTQNFGHSQVVPFFAYPPEVRRMIYTTNAIESLHRGLRKIIKTRGAFPNDEAAMKLLYLALRNIGVHWKPAIEWRAAYAQFTIFFSDRLPTTIR